MTILEAARLLRAKKVSSVELVEQSLQRISALNPKLNAFITVMEESARKAARVADQKLARGGDHSPLLGIPIAVKDVFKTRGVRTTAGSKLFAHHIPDHDAAVVERLAAAGGSARWARTTCTSWRMALRRTTRISARSAIHTIPAGFLAGRAADRALLAADMVFAAIGTDTGGGSICIPASYCGEPVGLKPTHGRVSRLAFCRSIFRWTTWGRSRDLSAMRLSF